LLDQDSGLMDRLGLEPLLINSSLQSLIEDLIYGQTQNVIQLELFIGQESVSAHSSEEGSPFEQPSGVFLLQSKKLSGSLSEFGKGQ